MNRGLYRGHGGHGMKRFSVNIYASCESKLAMHKSPFRVFRVFLAFRDSDESNRLNRGLHRGHNSVVLKGQSMLNYNSNTSTRIKGNHTGNVSVDFTTFRETILFSYANTNIWLNTPIYSTKCFCSVAARIRSRIASTRT